MAADSNGIVLFLSFFPLTVYRVAGEAHGMYSEGVGGGQRASLAFL